MKKQFQLKKDYDFQSDVLYLRIVDDYQYRNLLK
jgi:hypothetical protein